MAQCSLFVERKQSEIRCPACKNQFPIHDVCEGVKVLALVVDYWNGLMFTLCRDKAFGEYVPCIKESISDEVSQSFHCFVVVRSELSISCCLEHPSLTMKLGLVVLPVLLQLAQTALAQTLRRVDENVSAVWWCIRLFRQLSESAVLFFLTYYSGTTSVGSHACALQWDGRRTKSH